MADVLGAIRARLISDDAITDVVGDDPDDRIFPAILPQAVTLPAITLQIISEDRPHSSPQGPLKLCKARIQVDVWAARDKYTDAVNLAESVRKRLDGFRGQSAGVTIQGIFLESTRTLFESDPEQHRVSRDYMVSFTEEIG